MIRRPPRSTLFPYPPLSRSLSVQGDKELAFTAPSDGTVYVYDARRRPRGRARAPRGPRPEPPAERGRDRKSTRLNSSHANISYAVFCLKKKKKLKYYTDTRT